MTERNVSHGSFTVERRYEAPPQKVFTAWSDPTIKGKWYGDPEKESVADVFEFEVGGRELRQGEAGGVSFRTECRYYDIIENQRIVYAYDVIIDGARTSVSVAAVEFRRAGGGTVLVMTEHGAFLDGIEKPDERQGGAEFVLDRLADLLAAGN